MGDAGHATTDTFDEGCGHDDEGGDHDHDDESGDHYHDDKGGDHDTSSSTTPSNHGRQGVSDPSSSTPPT